MSHKMYQQISENQCKINRVKDFLFVLTLIPENIHLHNFHFEQVAQNDPSGKQSSTNSHTIKYTLFFDYVRYIYIYIYI